MKGVIYARFSEGPNQTDQSIEGQVADCKAYAEANDIDVIGLYADRHITGTSTEKRAEFLRMLADAEKGRFDCVIVWKIDRFGRNRQDIALGKLKLRRAGVKLMYAAESIPEGPEGIVLESVLEGIAEYYSAELRQKVIRGRRETLKKGLTVGSNLPIGYHAVDRRIEIDPETAPIVREMFDMYLRGEGLMACVDFLNMHGLTSARGGRITKSVVHRMLRNKRYVGNFDESGIERRVEGIIDEETFEEVQTMHKTSRNNAAGKAKEDYLLSCKCFCAYDGAMLTGEAGTGKKGKVYRYYKCGKRKRAHDCDLKPIPRDVLEDAVIDATIEDMLTDETIQAIADEIMAIQDEEAKTDPAAAYRSQLDGNRKKQANIVAAIETGAAPAALVARLGELEAEAKALEVEIMKAELEKPMIPRKTVVEWLESFRAGNKKDAAFRRRLVDTFIARIEVENGRAVIYYNVTDKKNGPHPRVRIRTACWRNRNGIRTHEPFVQDGYILLVIPLPAAA